MRVDIKLGRIFGVEIRAHLSWLIIVAIVMLSLASHFTMSQPEWSLAWRWSAAFLTSILFFSSVLAHELAHSVVAMRYGLPVKSITLFLFGGVSEIEGEAKRPADEFWIAIIGPLMSLAIAGLGGAVCLLFGFKTFIGAITSWLAGINLLLAIFNMLPGFPLDGGRVLCSIIWWKTGNSFRATRSAARVGQGFATILIMIGIWLILGPGRDFGGLWLVFLGWFLFDAAGTSKNLLEIEQALQGLTAADLMSTDFVQVAPNLPLSHFAYVDLLCLGKRSFLVNNGDQLLGIITAQELQSVGKEEWSQKIVADVMKPFDSLNNVSPEASAKSVLDRIVRDQIGYLPVINDGRVVGIIYTESLVQLIAIRREFGRRKEPQRQKERKGFGGNKELLGSR